MSVDQREGIVPMHDNWDIDLGAETDTDGDPPRVWMPNKDKPGCAFTRSIGDATGERVGVISDPELTKKEIKEHDKVRSHAYMCMYMHMSMSMYMHMLTCCTHATAA